MNRQHARAVQPPNHPEPVDPKQFRRLLDESRVRQSRNPGAEGTAVRLSPGRQVATRRSRLNPLAAKEDVLGRIREGFQDLNRVLGGIEGKLDAHNRNSEGLAESVRGLPQMMQELPEASKAGAELLGNIREALATQTEVTREMVTRVQELAQRIFEIPAVVGELNQRLDRQEGSREQTERSMLEIRASVAEMQAESAKLQRETMEEFRRAQVADREEARQRLDSDREVMRHLIDRSSRQSQILMALMVVLILAFVVFLLGR